MNVMGIKTPLNTFQAVASLALASLTLDCRAPTADHFHYLTNSSSISTFMVCIKTTKLAPVSSSKHLPSQRSKVFIPCTDLPDVFTLTPYENSSLGKPQTSGCIKAPSTPTSSRRCLFTPWFVLPHVSALSSCALRTFTHENLRLVVTVCSFTYFLNAAKDSK
jgi:hypothetical protein